MRSAIRSLCRVLHEIQKERGCIILFLCSNGKLYKEKITQRFLESDYAVEELISHIPEWEKKGVLSDKSIKKIIFLLDNVTKLTSQREYIIDQSIEASDALIEYSHKIIGPIIDLMVELALNDSENSSNRVSAFANFLHLKERIGRERVLGARGLVSESFNNPEFLENYRFLISEQKSYQDTFFALAAKSQKECYERHMNDYAVEKIEKMHQQLDQKQSDQAYDISPIDWYELVTQKIILMHQVEMDLTETLSKEEEQQTEQAQPYRDPGTIEKKYKDFILTLPLFKGLEEDALERLLHDTSVKEYNKGNLLLIEGEQPNRLYIILEGWVKIFKGNASGDESILQMLTSGDMVLESAVFLNALYPLNAQVTKKALILSLPATVVREQVKTNNILALNVLNGMSLHSQMMIQNVESVRLKSATERVGWFFLKLLLEQGRVPDMVELPYDKSLIASYLDMKPETFSRTLKKFKARGFEIRKDTVILPAVNALCGFCDSDLGEICKRHGTPDCPNPDCEQGQAVNF